jgi:hypothetical protein
MGLPPGLGLYINTYIVPHYPYVMAVTDRVVSGDRSSHSNALAAALTLQGCATE